MTTKHPQQPALDRRSAELDQALKADGCPPDLADKFESWLDLWMEVHAPRPATGQRREGERRQ